MNKPYLMRATAAIIFAAITTGALADFKEPLNELSSKQKEFRALAVKGDYQGMRNIAYSYVAPFKGEAGSKVAGCAWYLLVPAVHKDKFNSGDIGNVSVYCSKLSGGDLNTAYEHAFRTLVAASK